MERVRMWLFPVALLVGWLGGFAYALARLGELHATVAAHRQTASLEQPVSDARRLAKR
jgi:hypothetical protein